MTHNLTLPWPPKELSPNSRTHWSKRSKITKTYRDVCRALTEAAGIKIDWSGPVHLWMTFCPPDRRHRDDDNMVAAFKAGRDGMADALGVNDKRFRVHPWVSDKTGGFVLVRLTNGATVEDNES